MKNKYLIFFLFIFSLFMFTSCKNKIDIDKGKEEFYLEYSYYFNEENTNKLVNREKNPWTWFDKDTFKEAIDKNKVISISYDEFLDLLNSNKRFTIYFGFKPESYQCPYCVITLPYAINACCENNQDMYYLNIRPMRVANDANTLDELDKAHDYLLNLVKESFADYPEDTLKAATYVTFENGKAIKYHLSTYQDSEGNWEKILTDEEKSTLTNDFLELFK